MILYGLIAFGEKLINSRIFLIELKSLEKELIGGYIEATGLVSVCNEKHMNG